MSIGRAALLFAASVLAGAVNSVAGGGTLLSFPAAVAAGLPPIVANATNAVALVPGSLAAAWAYRRNLAGLERLTFFLALPAVAGALIGAAILRHTPQRLFDGVVPWLVLGATLLILFQSTVARRRAGSRLQPSSGGDTAVPAAIENATGNATAIPERSARILWPMMILQFLVSIYGGYFGAAMGIVMLAFLARLPAGAPGQPLDMHQMNALKNVLAVVINGSASIDFISHGLVNPVALGFMTTGAIAGGIVGGRLGRRAQPRHIRRLVVAIGFAMSGLLAWRRYG